MGQYLAGDGVSGMWPGGRGGVHQEFVIVVKLDKIKKLGKTG